MKRKSTFILDQHGGKTIDDDTADPRPSPQPASHHGHSGRLESGVAAGKGLHMYTPQITRRCASVQKCDMDTAPRAVRGVSQK